MRVFIMLNSEMTLADVAKANKGKRLVGRVINGQAVIEVMPK